MKTRQLYSYRHLGDWKINLDILWCQFDISYEYFQENMIDELWEIESRIQEVIDNAIN